jgi:Leucine-rich repeat (LRR) protein
MINKMNNNQFSHKMDFSFLNIDQIDSNAFTSNINHLEILIISNNNIENLQENMFSKLNNLIILDISFNKSMLQFLYLNCF